jgi:type IV pilus assembly protein PilB
MTSNTNIATVVAGSRRELQERLASHAVTGHQRLGEVLVGAGVINQSDLDQVLQEQVDDGRHRKLGELLVARGLCTRTELHQALARRLNMPFVQLHDFDFDRRAVALLNAEVARRHGVVPLMLEDEVLTMAVEDPGDAEVVELLHFITGKHIVLVAAAPEEIDYGISRCYMPFDDAGLVKELDRLISDRNPKQEKKEFSGRERPVVKLVQNIILDAIRQRASDIHLRPRERDAELVFRIDGSLITIRTFHKSVLPSIVSRIKILGNMDISEHRLPQDGQARMSNRGQLIDLRLSVIPTIHGESVVIRILDASQGLRDIAELGFTPEDEERFRNLVKRNQGLLLVTGPTGSGKSTTLYGALQAVIKQNVNIITVEDPVEYHLAGISQIQVNPHTGYSFAKALRHILRHDPDVIMVGEIRDVETAKMAVESALTGHLVLSTLHTNSAASSITRLLEIGVDAYLVNATLMAVLAQRLVRLNCPHCTEEETVSERVRADLGLTADEVFRRGAGCDHCFHTGFHGRHAVYELLEVDADIRALIRPGADPRELEACAIEKGMVPLTENALALARSGRISIAEVYRVRLT